MFSEKNILRLGRLALVLTFVVIVAGSVVRITGSGMGCPDWPFCFGYVVPPTDIEPLTFREGRVFEKGQMIILHDTRWVAQEHFTSTSDFNRSQWLKYPKHDYATFNATQTWIEYINRLATGLLGFPVLFMTTFAGLYALKEKKYWYLMWSLFVVFMIVFEAWLGKLVVDGNLKENSITYHMLGTMGIIAGLIAIVSKGFGKPAQRLEGKLYTVFAVLFVLAIVQIIMGTQVREEIDMIAKRNDIRERWIEELPIIFKIHRSFSIVITLLVAYLFMESRKWQRMLPEVKWIVMVIGVEIVSGVVLTYLGMPKAMQPLHLVCGMILFALCLSGIWRGRLTVTS